MFEGHPAIINHDEITKIVSNFQNENYKRQIDLLNEKLSIKEKEYTSQINNLLSQLTTLKDIEIKLRTSLSERDGAVAEFNQLVKDYQAELLNLRKNICEKDQKISDMNIKFNSLKSDNNTISATLDTKEETIKNMELNLDKAINDKNKITSKCEELVNIADEYKKQLDNLNSKNLLLENENQKLNNINNNLMKENHKLLNENNVCSKDVNECKKNLNEFENVTKEYNEQIARLQNEINNLNNQQIDNNTKLQALRDENDRLNNSLNDIKNNKNIIENELGNNIKLNKKNNEIIAQYEIDMQTIVKFCNENIKEINSFLDNYLDINESNKKISIENNENDNLDSSNYEKNNNNINFEKIKKKLNALENMKKNNISLIKKYKNDANDANNKLSCVMYDKNKYLEILNIIYNNIISEINAHGYFKINDILNSFNKQDEDKCIYILNIINMLINNLLQFLFSVNDEKNYLNNNVINLQKINEKISIENNQLKSKINENNNLKQSYEKIIQINKILEKKAKNLETELELKQMQINSLEEIVKRRGSNNNSMSMIDNNKNNEMTELVKKLEDDREKLIKDNMKLIQYNKKLKEQINSLKKVINDVNINKNFKNNSGNNKEIAVIIGDDEQNQ